ncbi:MAG TPA: PaaI family thioesterase [Thermoleophilaceae bacterium]|nr:PaaI family thioesterase [Thermoleophilaceae bacterium]
MNDAPRDGTELMRQFVPNSPFAVLLGLELVELGEGSARLRLPYRPELATMGETVHGGAIATALDTAAMAAAWAGAELPERLAGATASLSVEYVSAANGQDLDVVATLLRRGRSLCSVEAEARGPDGTLVAKALVTYKLG